MIFKVWNEYQMVYNSDNQYDATGYLVHYVGARGGIGVMVSPPESGWVSAIAERHSDWKVTVERFGTGADALRAFDKMVVKRGYADNPGQVARWRNYDQGVKT
jgi:hypothetical protein